MSNLRDVRISEAVLAASMGARVLYIAANVADAYQIAPKLFDRAGDDGWLVEITTVEVLESGSLGGDTYGAIFEDPNVAWYREKRWKTMKQQYLRST